MKVSRRFVHKETKSPHWRLTRRHSWPHLVLSLSVALRQLPEGAEVLLESSQLGCGGGARLPVAAAAAAAAALPHAGPQGEQEVADQELHPLGTGPRGNIWSNNAADENVKRKVIVRGIQVVPKLSDVILNAVTLKIAGLA